VLTRNDLDVKIGSVGDLRITGAAAFLGLSRGTVSNLAEVGELLCQSHRWRASPLRRDRRDRRPLRRILVLMLEHHPNGAITDLDRIPLRSF